MNPRSNLHGRSSVVASVVLVSLATFAVLAGCSKQPNELLGPTELVGASATSPILAAQPPLIARWSAPRIRVWTDGWRREQKEGGVSLEASKIYDFELPAQQPVTFNWSARPRSGQGEIIGYRWAVDMDDITDETPRSGPDDVTHWSTWSLVETSATVGPFGGPTPDSPGIHFVFVEARDNLGFVSLFPVRVRVFSAEASGEPVLRRPGR